MYWNYVTTTAFHRRLLDIGLPQRSPSKSVLRYLHSTTSHNLDQIVVHLVEANKNLALNLRNKPNSAIRIKNQDLFQFHVARRIIDIHTYTHKHITLLCSTKSSKKVEAASWSHHLFKTKEIFAFYRFQEYNLSIFVSMKSSIIGKKHNHLTGLINSCQVWLVKRICDRNQSFNDNRRRIKTCKYFKLLYIDNVTFYFEDGS